MKIALDAQEFLDRVEEQLAWLAIAGSCVTDYQDHERRRTKRTTFFTEHFRCAAPWVSLGGGDSAALDFSEGLGAEVGSKLETSHLERGELALLMSDMLGRLRRPLRQAEVREGVSFDGSKEDSYLLSSIAMLPPRDNVHAGPARGMRRIWFQDIALGASDAPSRNDIAVSSIAIRHDKRELLDGVDARPVEREYLHRVMRVAADQSCQEEQWTVELSLSKERTGLAIPTDGAGARDLLASMGRVANRKALVHWVKAHYRRKRGAGDPSLVRAHLRGTQFAITQHLYATVRPSIVDIDLACNGRRFDLDAAQESA